MKVILCIIKIKDNKEKIANLKTKNFISHCKIHFPNKNYAGRRISIEMNIYTLRSLSQKYTV